MVNWDNKQLESFLKLGILAVSIFLVNVLSQKLGVFSRWDLTEDQRYSIQNTTKNVLKELDDVVYIEVYLDGDLSAGFRRLRNAIEEKLEQFKVYAGANITYKFIDPETAQSTEAKNEFFKLLFEKGIQGTNVFDNENGKRTQKLIFPGAIVSYGGQERPVILLKGSKAAGPQEQLNQSIEGVEYELASAIRSMTSTGRKRIAFLEGKQTLSDLEVSGITNTLLTQYDVFKTNLNRSNALSNYDAVLINKPLQKFTELDRYKIDQYIMSGGKVLFFLDLFNVNMDSVGEDGTLEIARELGLESLLFKYGVRINPQIVQDLNSGAYPIVTGNFGNQPQIGLLPWPFHPVLVNFPNHPVTKNLDAVITRFVSPIDTVKASGVKKTPLLFTSEYTRALASPVRVAFSDFQDPPGPELFQQKNLPVGYLLEGNIQSAFKNRLLPVGVTPSDFIEQSASAQIFVASDGDFLRNEINIKTGNPVELGVEQFSGARYANEEFILNLLNYMLDENRLIEARTKDITLRPLNQIKLNEEKTYWQVLNIVLPVVLIALFGVLKFFYRKNKFTKNN